jgi:putative hydroxymethylpyrimidine transport system substrate-binding protein
LNHPDTAWAVFAGTDPELDDELNRRAWIDTLPRLALSPAALDHRRYQRFADFLVEQGLIEKTLPLGDYAVDLFAEP